jgi:hypothetical protein
MIYATNSAIITINSIKGNAEDLAAKHALCRKYVNATFGDILPTKEDDMHIELVFKVVMQWKIQLHLQVATHKGLLH